MKKEIAIVCDGTEISFGMNLLHLIKYEENDNSEKCKKYYDYDAEIYTIKVFERTKKSSNALKVFVGKVGSPEGKPIFEKYGINIWINDDKTVCVADASNLKNLEYADFLKYANGIRIKYLNSEKEYVSAVSNLNPKWIMKEFKQITGGGLFGRSGKKKEMLQQLYDCAALILFDEMISGDK